MATPMKKRGGRAKGYFPRVAEARKILTDEAVELYKLYKQIAIDALAAQDFAVAEKAVGFLLTHMPEDEDTGTLLNTDIDKNKEPDVKGGGGPSIQIGLALGGMPSSQKALPTITQIVPNPDKE
jgi:hypothetical protein